MVILVELVPWQV
jgi:DNA invertase Pin-like site-specific DNA recombinase